MKNPLKFFTIFLVAVAACMSAGCAEDGDPGPAGEQGDPGKNGETGANGENGAGVEEALQYGNVTLSLTGQRPDTEKEFKKDLNFRFTPVGVSGIFSSSVVYVDGVTRTFTIRRFYSTPAAGFQDNQVTLNVSVDTDGEKPVVTGVTFYVRTIITTDDFKYFYLEGDFYEYALTGTHEYTYDPTTGELDMKLSFTVPGNVDFNTTGHDLTVDAMVNVKVFESM
jgi:hypothetical protein